MKGFNVPIYEIEQGENHTHYLTEAYCLLVYPEGEFPVFCVVPAYNINEYIAHCDEHHVKYRFVRPTKFVDVNTYKIFPYEWNLDSAKYGSFGTEDLYTEGDDV